MTAETPCTVCTGTAQAGRHEPFVVGDLRTWTRVWRCFRCGAVWSEGDRVATPIGEGEVDELLPRWRDQERWLASTTVPALLRAYRTGHLEVELLALALLPHDVVGTGTDATDPSDLVLYSSADAALADGQDSGTLTRGFIARRLRWASGRRRVIVDPASPWGGALEVYVVEYLDANGRRTDTASDGRRETARAAA